MKNILYILVLTAFLLGCGPVTPIASKIHKIKFQSPNLQNKDLAEENGLDLRVNIFATNKDIVFLYGSMEIISQPFPMQSTLLRSSDEGKSWQEVLAPLETGVVRKFFMIKSGIGWALTWDIKNNYSLYQSNDYGERWEKISKISTKKLENPIPINFVFADDQHGQLDMLYSADRIEFLTTEDGGRTWVLSGVYSPNFDYQTKVKIFSSYIKTKEYNSIGQDFSFWKLEIIGSQIVVSHIINYVSMFNDSLNTWETTSTIPYHYELENNQLIVP